jgi:hypothetical protein
MEMENMAGRTISSLILHQLHPGCIERARLFITSHGGRWISLPPSTGAKYFIAFPTGTYMLPDTSYWHPNQQRYHIYLPDGAHLLALSIWMAERRYRSNTIILPINEPAFSAIRPVLPIPFYTQSPLHGGEDKFDNSR